MNEESSLFDNCLRPQIGHVAFYESIFNKPNEIDGYAYPQGWAVPVRSYVGRPRMASPPLPSSPRGRAAASPAGLHK